MRNLRLPDSGWGFEPKAGWCWLMLWCSLSPVISPSPVPSLPSAISRSTETLLWAVRSMATICPQLSRPLTAYKPGDPLWMLASDPKFSDPGSVPLLKPVHGLCIASECQLGLLSIVKTYHCPWIPNSMHSLPPSHPALVSQRKIMQSGTNLQVWHWIMNREYSDI